MTELLRAAEAVLDAYMVGDEGQLAEAIHRLGVAVAQIETVEAKKLVVTEDDDEIGYYGVR
jgi:hypothetical protein